MKAAANIIAVLGWGGFLVALWWPLLAGSIPPWGLWFAVTAVSSLVGLIVPGYLLNLEARMALVPPTRQGRSGE